MKKFPLFFLWPTAYHFDNSTPQKQITSGDLANRIVHPYPCLTIAVIMI